DRAANGNFPSNYARNFASRAPATRVDRVPFEQQQRSVSNFGRSGFTSAPNAGNGAGNSGSFSRPANESQNRGGWRQLGERPASNSTGSGSASQTPSSHGWGRFGEPIHGNGAAADPGSNSSRGWDRSGNTRPPSGASQNFSQEQRSFGD